LSRQSNDEGGISQEALANYASASQLTMELSGDWPTGGWLVLSLDGQPFDRIRIRRPQWTVLAKLFLGGIYSNHWSNAFVETKTLIQALREHKALKGDVHDNNVHRLIRRIRLKLADSKTRESAAREGESGDEWAERLLETSDGPGYRIALPPTSLTLLIGDRRIGTHVQNPH
jgi:hypothetical protein